MQLRAQHRPSWPWPNNEPTFGFVEIQLRLAQTLSHAHGCESFETPTPRIRLPISPRSNSRYAGTDAENAAVQVKLTDCWTHACLSWIISLTQNFHASLKSPSGCCRNFGENLPGTRLPCSRGPATVLSGPCNRVLGNFIVSTNRKQGVVFCLV